MNQYEPSTSKSHIKPKKIRYSQILKPILTTVLTISEASRILGPIIIIIWLSAQVSDWVRGCDIWELSPGLLPIQFRKK